MLEILLLVYLGVTFASTLILGFLQARCKPEESVECYSTTAVVAMSTQAVISVTALAGTGWFWLAATWLAFTLLCHHTIIHWNSRFQDETCSCAPFQCKDVSNHETWVVACLVAAVVSLGGV